MSTPATGAAAARSRGRARSLGYSNDNGADRGWKAVAGSNERPRRASSANWARWAAYDKFDIRASNR
jgi:hypothetical protein